MNLPIKYGLVAWLFLLAACSGEQIQAPAKIPRGYYATLRIVADGRQLHIGPFVGYYFKPVDPSDFSRMDFICLNERQFYTKDLPDGAKLYEGEAIQTTLPREIPLPSAQGDRMHPIFDKDIPAAWWATQAAAAGRIHSLSLLLRCGRPGPYRLLAQASGGCSFYL